MRFSDWLNKCRHPRVVARKNIRTRRRQYIQFAGPIVAIERLEDRCVLAAPTAAAGSVSIHLAG